MGQQQRRPRHRLAWAWERDGKTVQAGGGEGREGREGRDRSHRIRSSTENRHLGEDRQDGTLPSDKWLVETISKRYRLHKFRVEPLMDYTLLVSNLPRHPQILSE